MYTFELFIRIQAASATTGVGKVSRGRKVASSVKSGSCRERPIISQ